MEAKKTKKVMMMLMSVAILIFAAVLYLNNHLDSKKQNEHTDLPQDESSLMSGVKQSYLSSNNPVLEEGDFYVGKKEADLKIFVYEDYTDVFSAELNKSLAQAKDDFGDNILFIYRPFNIKHDNTAVNAAIALSCAADQNKGEIWREQYFSELINNNLTIDNFDVWVDELKLNKDDFQVCLTNQSKQERIEKLMSQAASYSVYGAPTLFVDEEMIVGARPYQAFTDSNGDEIEGLKQVIERQLK